MKETMLQMLHKLSGIGVGSTGGNYKACIIYISILTLKKFPFFTGECYSSLQVKSLTLKDIKVIKLLH